MNYDRLMIDQNQDDTYERWQWWEWGGFYCGCRFFFFLGLRNNLFYDFRINKKKKKKNLSRFGRGFTAAIQGQWTEWPHWKQNFKDKNDNWLKLKRRN